MKSNVVLALIILLLLGGCTAITGGDMSPWPATLAAVVVIIGLKLWNDRSKALAWPMEFLLIAGVTMIVINLGRLYFLPLPY
jgi:hypothetical protein